MTRKKKPTKPITDQDSQDLMSLLYREYLRVLDLPDLTTLYTKEEMCEILKVSMGTLDKLIKQQKLNPIYVNDRVVRVTHQDYLNFIKSCQNNNPTKRKK